MKFHCKVLIAGCLYICMNLSVAADWSTPVPISAGDSQINATGTPLTIDTNSNAFVGWLDGQVGMAQTLSSANLPFSAAAWTTPQLIFSNTFPAPAFPTFPVLVLNNNSTKQLAVWVVIDPSVPSSTFEASRRDSSTANWPTPFPLFFPAVPNGGGEAGGNLGNVATVIAFTSTNSPPFDITLFTLPANSDAWTTPVQLAVDNSAFPAVDAVAQSARAVFAWKVNMPMLELQGLRFVFATGESTPTSNIPLPAGLAVTHKC